MILQESRNSKISVRNLDQPNSRRSLQTSRLMTQTTSVFVPHVNETIAVVL